MSFFTFTRDRRIRTGSGRPVVFFGVYDRESGELIETFSNREDARDAEARWSRREGVEAIVVRLRPEYA